MTLFNENIGQGTNNDISGIDMSKLGRKKRDTTPELEAWREGLRRFFALNKHVRQADIAEAADLSSNFLSMVITGKKNPSMITQKKLTDIVGKQNIYGPDTVSKDPLSATRELKFKQALEAQKNINAELELQLSDLMVKYAELSRKFFELTRSHEELDHKFKTIKAIQTQPIPSQAHDSSHAELVTYFQQKELAKQMNWNLIKLEKADPRALNRINEIIKIELKTIGIDEDDLSKLPLKQEA